MNTLILIAFSSVLVSGDPLPQTGTFQNPILSGFYPDPSLCRVGDDYYMVNSSFEYFPGVPIFHSKDLVHWRQIGHCLTRKSQLPLTKVRASGGIYAPTLRYNKGTFYMVTTNVDGGGHFFVTAKDPAGEWSDPVWLRGDDGIDPSLFFDEDGKVYYTREGGGERGGIFQSEIDVRTGVLLAKPRLVWRGTGGVWPEGPHLYKINGRYYLMISEGGTSYDHMVTIARSDSPWGPFESNPNNPILTHRHLQDHPIQAVGHADWVETPDGWWLVCLGIRPQGGRFHHMGRETFLAPVVFNEEGWPVVHGNGTIDLELQASRLKPQVWELPQARDGFDVPSLALQWNFLRNPYEADYSLTERPGFLRLHGSAVSISDKDSPAFVGRRQMAFNCVASTLLEFDPKADHEEAGLVARGNDKHHYEIGVTLRQGKRQVFFRMVLKGQTVEPVQYRDVQPGPVVLSVAASPLSYEFGFQASGGLREVLGTALTKDLSVEAIGFADGMCFTGVYFGMYASGNGQRCAGPADFDWFEYRDSTVGQDAPSSGKADLSVRGSEAFASGQYRNLFVEAGLSQQEVAAKIYTAFQQLFHGDPNDQSVYFQAGTNSNGPRAYLRDINSNDVRSEGMSYGMMIAVQMDKKAEFDALWNWARTYMYHDSPSHPGYGYFSWSMRTSGQPNDEMPAPDGEEYFAMALYFAAGRWGNGTGIYDYRAAADRLLTDMVHRDVITGPTRRGTRSGREMFPAEHTMVRFTPDTDFTDPSYHLPAFYELWSLWGPIADRPFWAKAAVVSRDFLTKVTHPVTGLAPDLANFDGTLRGGQRDSFQYDAWRTAMIGSVDWAWWAKDIRERQWSDRLQAFFESKGMDEYGNRFSLDGTRQLGSDHSTGLVAVNAVASLAATHPRARQFVLDLWNQPVPSGRYRYYDGMLYLMGLLHCSGEFRIWPVSASP